MVFEAEGIDKEDLLVCLLSEVLAAFELQSCYVTRAEAGTMSELDGLLRVEVRCRCVVIDHNREGGLSELKAVTYHGVRVEEEGEGWRARVVFDL